METLLHIRLGWEGDSIGLLIWLGWRFGLAGNIAQLDIWFG